MGDFGLYAALSGTDNWAQKRQDKASNLMMLGQMEQRSQQEVAAQMQAEQGIQEQLDKINEFDVLPEDKKDIEEAEQRSRLGIIKGITKFNGDLRKYMASGGLTDLGEYRRGILNSSEMKNAVHNKGQYAQYLDAKQKDMFVGSSEIEVPVFDSKGNPKMKDGEIVRERKRLTMDQQLALKKRGMLDRINVGMIEKKGNVNPQFFKSNFKDARKPWSKDNIVTEMDVREALKLQGISDEQADKMSSEYGRGLTNENALKWKAMNYLDLELTKSKIAAQKAAAAKSRAGTRSAKTRITNTIPTQYARLEERPSRMLPKHGRMGKTNARGASLAITADENKFFQEAIKRLNPQAFDAHFEGMRPEDQQDGHGTFDLRNSRINLREKVSVYNPITKQNEAMIQAEVFYDLKNATEYMNSVQNNWKEHTYQIKDVWNKQDEEFETRTIEGFIGKVYIPIDNLVKDKGMMTELAKDLNRGTNIDNYQQGATNQSVNVNNQQNINEMIQFLQTEKGISYEKAQQIVYQRLSNN